MGESVITRSRGQEAIKSAGQELNIHVTPLITIQRMVARKLWTGLVPTWTPGWFTLPQAPPSGPNGYWGTIYYPPPAWRASWRMKFNSWTSRQKWSFTPPFTGVQMIIDSTGQMAMAGPGNCPVNPGLNWYGIDDHGNESSGPWGVLRPGDGFFDWNNAVPWGNNLILGTSEFYPNPSQPTAGYPATVNTLSYVELKVSNIYGDPNSLVDIQCTGGLIPSSGPIGMAAANISSRAWPAFPFGYGAGVSQTNYAWSEYNWPRQDAASLNPAAYSGLPIVDGTPFFYANPYFGWNPASQPGGGDPYQPYMPSLWNGWFWYPQSIGNGNEEVLGAGAANGAPQDMILAQRVRWSPINTIVPYFFASAVITRPPYTNSEWPATDVRTRDDLSQVSLLTQGVAAPGQIIELPWLPNSPAAGDFVQTNLPVAGYSTLSAGMMVFCIVGESPQKYSQRTGIAIG